MQITLLKNTILKTEFRWRIISPIEYYKNHYTSYASYASSYYTHSALNFQISRECIQIRNLIIRQETNRNEITKASPPFHVESGQFFRSKMADRYQNRIGKRSSKITGRPVWIVSARRGRRGAADLIIPARGASDVPFRYYNIARVGGREGRCARLKNVTRYGCKSSAILDSRQTNSGACATCMQTQKKMHEYRRENSLLKYIEILIA